MPAPERELGPEDEEVDTVEDRPQLETARPWPWPVRALGWTLYTCAAAVAILVLDAALDQVWLALAGS